jgi:predicted DNA-binding transcriptional regulator AlpA
MAERMRMPPGSVLGAVDVAQLLGVTRQRVSQLKKDPTFPRPGIGYGRVGLWHRAGIQCWAAAHRPERTSAGGRFHGEAAALLLAAEAHARRMGIHWVDAALYWLTVSHGEAGPRLRDAVLSMGITPDEIEAVIDGWRPSDDRPKRTRRMNPRLQSLLAAADRLAQRERRRRVRAIDILLRFIDEKVETVHRPKPASADHVLAVLHRRGLDIDELRRRLVAAATSETPTFEPRALRPRRDRPARRPAWLDLAPNPLGHDPWTRRPWGAAFARTRDGRHLEVDGDVWFFTIDGDGFYVRAADGRPVGYRYRKLKTVPKRTPRPVNGFMEILPMPPVEMDHWPDHRFGGGD